MKREPQSVHLRYAAHRIHRAAWMIDSGASALHCGRVLALRLYDLRSTYATRLSAGGVVLRHGDSQVFKKHSQMKLQMKREASCCTREYRKQ